MTPEISIIIPSYNQPAGFVRECFESVCSQQGPSFEIIFVDGGSKPETLTAAEAFRDRCAHFISEPDEGQADAINKGLRLAKGDLVTWLNTDDFYEPEAFRHVAESHAKNPKAAFYMGIGYRTDITGKEKRPFYPDKFKFKRDAFLYGLNFILQPATFIRREALEKTGALINKDLHYVLDTELWHRLLATGEPEWVPYPVACSREYADTKTARGGWPRFNEIQRLAAETAGVELTPGVLAELMGMIHRLLLEPEIKELFPKETKKKADELWACAAEGMRKVSGRSDGFPVKSFFG